MAALAVLVTATTLSRPVCPDYWDLATRRMKNFDNDRMQGTWYEMISRPITGFTDSCACLTDTLEPRNDDSEWSELYEARCPGINGYKLFLNSTIFPNQNTSESGKWTVSVSGGSDWWILDHHNYEYALVYACGFFTAGDQGPEPQEYTYYFSRTPEKLPSKLVLKWTTRLLKKGVDIWSMKEQVHDGCWNGTAPSTA